MGLSIYSLENCFNGAKATGSKYVGVKIQMYGFDYCEIIINPKENFDKKLEYYQNAYNTDLTLKNAPDKIKLVGFTYGNTYQEIESQLI